MPRAKLVAVSNEQIVAALISTGSATSAAAACGISARAIYNRMHTKEFKMLYLLAKAEILRTAETKLTGRLAAAIDTIAEVMENPENNPAVRMQAAQAIISNAAKISGQLMEVEAAHEHKSNCWDSYTPPDLMGEGVKVDEIDRLADNIFGAGTGNQQA